MRRNVVCAAVAMLSLFAAPSAAEEGMWTFDNFPSARMQSEMGWAPDQPWLDRVMNGTARLPGCSGSVVSGQGLVLTNHHCIIACLQALSNETTNLFANGFLTRTTAEERRCPGMDVSVLENIEDITGRIDAAAAAAPPESFVRVRNAEIARLESECSTPSRRCEVVTLYQGGRYALYRYRHYTDVRLVFAPERDIAAFGGEPDNFNFPRYCADFAFLRLYDNGAPAATPSHLAMRFTPVAAGEIVLAAGNPGATSRLRTTAELTFERDVNLPWRLSVLAEQRRRLLEFSERGPNESRIAASALQNVENSFKALSGRRAALANPQGLARVASREADLQARVRRNLAAQREVGDAWGEIARAQAAYRSFYLDHQLLEARAGERSDLFSWARDIVRGAAERDKDDAARMPRYTQARIAAVVNALRADRQVLPDLEALSLGVWLSKVQEHYAVGSPIFRRVLAGEAPDSLARRLATSRLADPAFRMNLWDGGSAAVAATDDPMIAFVRAWDADARAVRGRYLQQVERPVARAQERIARARFRAFGDAHYPEAAFSPRLSYGRVAGWTESGRDVAPFTRVGALYDRATGSPPYQLNQRWIGARALLEPGTVVNLTSSNDLIGGNSGGPLLDQEGRVVGAIFDGNIHSLGGEYFYDGDLNRAISVSATLIREALIDVYGLAALAAELEGRPSSTRH